MTICFVCAETSYQLGIEKMPDKNATPPTLVNFKQHQEEYLKLLEKFPMFKEVIAGTLVTFLKKVIDEGCFYIRVHAHNLPKILEDGRLANVIETGTSASFGGKKHRITSTDILFGCNKENLSPEDYPKFGYLSTADGMDNVIHTYDMGYKYGNIVIKLRKENLIHRTTITIGSTTELGSYAFMVPTKTDDVKATCVCGVKHCDIETPLDLTKFPPMFAYTQLILSIANKKLTTDNYYRLNELLGEIFSPFESFELQYHGQVTYEDFEEIQYLDDGTVDSAMVEQISPYLEKYNIKLSPFALNY